MADVTPDIALEQQRLKMLISAQESSIEQQKFALLEMAVRKTGFLTNIEAAQRAIADYKGQLQGLDKEHGALSTDQIDAKVASI